MIQKYIDRMEGYKATDKDMRCKGFQLELGKWYEIEGDIKLCKKGFHFYKHPSGVRMYYAGSGVRMFKVEAEKILDLPETPGASYKLVCKRIRLTEEIFPSGDDNTGDDNIGDDNTGDDNIGDNNTGNRNSGSRNSGYGNSGYGNSGNDNTGNGNTGRGNIGSKNSGNGNIGNGNTGRGNSGSRNSGNLNATNYSSGLCCIKEPTVICFDIDTGLTRNEFVEKYGWPSKLKWESLKHLPGATKRKFNALVKGMKKKIV